MTTKLPRVLLCSWIAGLSLLPIAASAEAQENPQDGSADASTSQPIEEILVTGSRIRGVAPVGSPVIAIDSDDIAESGAVTTAQLLQEVPQVFNLGISENSRGQAGGSGNVTYGTAINIRGIGPYATLTLFNGHRLPLSGTLGQAVDPSIIPTIALQRIEIVADGASAIYGTDAVAGVVNMIPRTDFEGVLVQGRYGVADEFDENQVGVLAGTSWSTGNLTFAFEHAFRDALNGADRSFFTADLSDRGGSDFRNNQCSPGTILTNGTSYAVPEGGVTPATAALLVPGTQNLCDNLRDQDLIPRQERDSALLTWNQEIGGIDLSGDAYYSRRTMTYRNAMDVASVFVPASNPFFVTPPGAEAAVAADGGLTMNYWLVDDLGPYNTVDGDIRSYGASVEAGMDLGSTWRGSIQAFAGRDESEVGQFRLNAGALTAAINSTDPATAFNPFVPGATSQSVLDGLNTLPFFPSGTNEIQQLQVQADGPLWSMAGGDVRLAVGGEYSHGVSIFEFGTRYSKQTRNVLAGFVEVLVPFVGPDNSRPGIQSLELSLAGRFEDYSDSGSTTNPKIGLSWMPFDGFAVRGSYGTSFRAPLLSDLQTATAGLFVQNYSDPLSPTGSTIGVAQSGGNPDLDPEEADTYSIGIDYSPAALEGLDLSLTYFSIDYTNQIAQYLSDLSILQRESFFESIIIRNPDPAFIDELASQLPVRGVIPADPELYVDGRLRNLGSSLSRGFDFSASYEIFSDSLGDLRFSALGTYYTTYETQITPTSPSVDALNTIFNPLEFKARASARWKQGGITALLALNHVGGYDNDRTSPVQGVDSYTTWDLHLSYQLQASGPLAGLRFGIDVTNLTDEDPPFVNIAPSRNGGGGFDPTASNPIGRLAALTIGMEF